jgi:hypothetical protein
LDYLGSTCPKLLLEPQRTNLVTNSEDFTSASWSKYNGATATANTAVSPDGTTTADTIEKAGGSGGTGFYYVANGITSNTTNAFSVFLKYKEGSGIVWLLGKNSGTFAFFNLQTGAALSASAGMTTKIENYGNGWYRCSFVQDYTSASAYTFGFGVCLADGTPNYNATTAATQGVYAWGAQFEAGAYATSYIPTTSAAVTRLADYAYSNQSPTANFGSGAFSVFFDIENVNSFDGSASENSAFVGNRQSGEWWRFYGSPGPDQVFFEVSSSAGGYAATSIGTVTAFKNGRNKVAISRSATRFICYVNGVEKINSTSAVFLQNFDSTNSRIELNAWESGLNAPTNAKFNQLLIFKGTALTAAQLAEITTL